MKLDRVERIIIPIAIALIILLIITQMSLYSQNKRLETQVNILQKETEIARARDEYIEAKLDLRTHPAAMNQRNIDWMLKQGEFAE
jgi:cell division protein FtsL